MLSSMAPTSDDDTPQRGYFGPPPGEVGPIGFESGPEPDPPKATNVSGPADKPRAAAAKDTAKE